MIVLSHSPATEAIDVETVIEIIDRRGIAFLAQTLAMALDVASQVDGDEDGEESDRADRMALLSKEAMALAGKIDRAERRAP